MSNDQNGKTNLIEIRDLLKLEMDKFTSINSEMIDNKSDFEKIGKNYEEYSGKIDKGRDHITQLKRREFFENLFVYIGFFFFYGCVAIIILRRFPIHKIIFFFISLFKKTLLKITGLIPNQKDLNITFEQNNKNGNINMNLGGDM
ncbi:MAG: hypothetical protein MJ252_13160 [archaeon]|nr:hypothetical protein [archaeon]